MAKRFAHFECGRALIAGNPDSGQIAANARTGRAGIVTFLLIFCGIVLKIFRFLITKRKTAKKGWTNGN